MQLDGSSYNIDSHSQICKIPVKYVSKNGWKEKFWWNVIIDLMDYLFITCIFISSSILNTSTLLTAIDASVMFALAYMD